MGEKIKKRKEKNVLEDRVFGRLPESELRKFTPQASPELGFYVVVVVLFIVAYLFFKVISR